MVKLIINSILVDSTMEIIANVTKAIEQSHIEHNKMAINILHICKTNSVKTTVLDANKLSTFSVFLV